MKITNIRLRYAQLFVICILSMSSYILYQSISNLSLSSEISQFEKNFWNRKLMIESFIQLKLSMGNRVYSQTLIGKPGWIEYSGDKNLDDYQNVTPISSSTLLNTQEKISKLYNELQKRNITLLIVIAPNKATIYPDKLPDEIQKLNPKSNLDLFKKYMINKGPAVLLDIRPALQNGRKKQAVYYSTDTHWNTYGAFIAYTEIMKKLSKTYPQLIPKDIKDFNIEVKKPYLHGVPKVMGATNMLEAGVEFIPIQKNNITWATINDDGIVPMQVSTIENKNLPKLIMYMDSFGHATKNFISLHFRQATFIQNSTKYPELMSLKKIDEIKPNIIIIEMVERSFSNNRLDRFLTKLLSETNIPNKNQNTTP